MQPPLRLRFELAFLLAFPLWMPASQAVNYALIGWNDLGMHCTDGADFSVFSLLPPYNTIHAQLISQGRLVASDSGITITYEAVADPDGSLNTTSQGKGNFWQCVASLYGTNVPPDMGLAGFAMPGPANKPQPMAFDPAFRWFSATGIPITPYDDTGRKNYYPLMRLTARNGAGSALATTDIVLPVSDEITCRACHASGGHPVAQPAAGWVWECDVNRDYKLNILRLHDQYNASLDIYADALRAAGYHPDGLYATVRTNGQPVLCARCHLSNALAGSGTQGVPPLTQSIHSFHASVQDPIQNQPLGEIHNRSACYRCHPGAETRCLRGVMGHAVAADGAMAMQCQDCHGGMSAVGQPGRRGWLEEPVCQSCHTGTATSNNGQLRYDSVFASTNQVRQAINLTFATTTNTPEPGLSLYRFSSGHGGLRCEACHGSTHAEYPSAHRNDNLQSQALQGHIGPLAECTACHTTQPTSASGGPHGLHPIGSSWINDHKSPGRNTPLCTPCHGVDLRGTALSRSQADRTLNVPSTKRFWRGFQIGCYTCHRGPTNDSTNPNQPAIASNASIATPAGNPAALTLRAADPEGNPLTYRIVSQPAHGTVALAGQGATYYPEAGYVGPDSFTFAAWDGSTDSNLGTVTVTVTADDCVLTASATAPDSVSQNTPAPFRAGATLTRCAATVTYDWDFGDGSPHVTEPNACHTYALPGGYRWTLKVTTSGAAQTINGVVEVAPGPVTGVLLTITRSSRQIVIFWPAAAAEHVLEQRSEAGGPALWQGVPEPITTAGGQRSVTLAASDARQFFRLRKGP